MMGIYLFICKKLLFKCFIHKIYKFSKNNWIVHKIIIFDDNEHVIWLKLFIVPKLWTVTKAVFVKKTRQ